ERGTGRRAAVGELAQHAVRLVERDEHAGAASYATQSNGRLVEQPPELHAHAPILEVAATLEVALQREHHAGPQERDAGAQAHAVAPVALPHRHDHRAGGTGRTRGNLDLVDEEVV